MKRRCLGWVEPRHKPLIFGVMKPYEDTRYTDGACPECERKMKEALQ